MKYGVIEVRTIYHAGDERSRTNPGHGYPEHTEQAPSFRSFENEAALKTWINSQRTMNFKVIEYQELEIKKETKIEFKRPVASRVS